MAKEVKLALEKRANIGSAHSRRLRKQNQTPGNLYGHHQDPIPVQIADDVLHSAVTHGAHVVDIELDGKAEKAMFREVQWDSFGQTIYHFDLIRVDANERVRVTLPIELKGTAPGALSGGILEQVLHEVEIDCLAIQIPDSLVVRVSELQLDQAIYVRDIPLPENSHVHALPDAIVVHVVQPAQEIVVAPAEGVAEPEVIGRKPAAEGDEEAPAKK